MRVAFGGLDRRAAESLADHRQTLAGGRSGRCAGVMNVVDPNVLQSGTSSDPLPERLEVAQAHAIQRARDDPGVFLDALGAVEEFDGRLAQAAGTPCQNRDGRPFPAMAHH